MGFPGLMKNRKGNFQELIKNKVEFSEVIKKWEFPGVWLEALKFPRDMKTKFCGVSRCEKTPKASRGRGFKNVCTQPPCFFSGIVHY